MSKSTGDVNRDRKLAVALAELKDTDTKEEFNTCVNDIKKLAEVDKDEAKIIASAFRVKSLSNLARQAGLDDQAIEGLVHDHNDHDNHRGLQGMEHRDFADDDGDEDYGAEMGQHFPIKEEKDELVKPIEDDECTDDIISNEDDSEVKDESPMAHVEMEIPVDMLNELKEALREVVGDQVDEVFPDGPETETPSLKELGEELPEQGDETMSDEKLAARKAERKKLLGMVKNAQEKPKDIGLGHDNIKQTTQQRTPENKTTRITPKDVGLGSDTAWGPGTPQTFKYDNDSQPKKTQEYPSMTLQNSEGNSLKEQNPTYNPSVVYTTNPELLQFDTYQAKQFTETPVDTLTKDADVEIQKNIPSEDGEMKDGPYTGKREDGFIVPTQMESELPAHKTTQASASQGRIVECMGCNNPNATEVHYAQCVDCKAKLAICEDCENSGYCPSCAATIKEADNKEAVHYTVTPEDLKSVEDPSRGDLDVKSQNKTTPNYKESVHFTVTPEDIKSVEDPSRGDLDVKSQNKNNDNDDVCPHCGKSMKAAMAEMTRQMELREAKIKSAYNISARLALANIIDMEGINENAEMWLNDGLSVKAMITQGNLMIRSAQNVRERVVSASVENKELTPSFNPTYVSQDTNNIKDIKEALKDCFTTPETLYKNI